MANDTMMRADPLVVARFWSKVDVRRPGECWPWQEKSRNEHGYGIFRPTKNSGVVKAHRFAWEIANGRPPGAAGVRHTCDNPPCCNPGHLKLGTQAENVGDMHGRRRRKYAARVSPGLLKQIHARLAAGETQRSIAGDLGVSQPYISMLAAGSRANAIRKGITTHGK